MNRKIVKGVFLKIVLFINACKFFVIQFMKHTFIPSLAANFMMHYGVNVV
jgi:hypothetical protein